MRKIKKLILVMALLYFALSKYNPQDIGNISIPEIPVIETLPSYEEGEKEAPTLTECELLKVVDGDTLTVLFNGEKAKVRLIGIDTPESVHSDAGKNTEIGNIASDYTKALLSDTKYVYLEFDEDMYDTFDRLLAYVYIDEAVTSARQSLNYHLANEGYAKNKEYPPNVKYAALFKDAFEDAKEKSKGLWIYEETKTIWQ